jgi:hypothetical protein
MWSTIIGWVQWLLDVIKLLFADAEKRREQQIKEQEEKDAAAIKEMEDDINAEYDKQKLPEDATPQDVKDFWDNFGR